MCSFNKCKILKNWGFLNNKEINSCQSGLMSPPTAEGPQEAYFVESEPKIPNQQCTGIYLQSPYKYVLHRFGFLTNLFVLQLSKFHSNALPFVMRHLIG